MDTEFIKSISRKICAIPPLPEAARKLMLLTSSYDTDINEISSLIANDAALTAKILQIVNSPFYGIQKNITRINQAVVILGFNAIKTLAISIALVKSNFDSNETPYFDTKQFWLHSLTVATISKEIASLFPNINADDAFLAGLLHDIGKIILLEHSYKQYEIVLEHASVNKLPLNVAELELLEITHSDVGSEICHTWHIPSHVAYAVGSHHSDLPTMEEVSKISLGNIVNIANNLAHLFDFGDSGNYQFDMQVIDFLTNLNISNNQLFSKICGIENSITSLAAPLNLMSPNALTKTMPGKSALLLVNDDRNHRFLELLLTMNHYHILNQYTPSDSNHVENLVVVYDDEKHITNVPQNAKFINLTQWRSPNNTNSRNICIKHLKNNFFS